MRKTMAALVLSALVLVTLGFQAIGESLGRLMDPGSAHE